MSDKPLIVAELSANHNGRIDRALRLVEAAKASGADAIKLQAYRAESLTIDHDGPGFVISGGIWDGRKLIDLYREAETTPDMLAAIFAHARTIGIPCFSSVFDREAVDFIEQFDPPAYKIASFEITDIPLIRYAASKGRPLIISTGMASSEDINEARIASVAAPERTLLHCISSYPSDPGTADLGRMAGIGKLFGLPTGLSDHTLSVTLPAVAVGLGATVIEKHLTLDRSDGGPDAAFSLEPHEFKAMVVNCREAWAAIQKPAAVPMPHRDLRRSLYVVADIAAGEILTADNIRSIRPGHGLHPREWDRVIGKPAVRDLKRGLPLALVDIDCGNDRREVREAVGMGRLVAR
ncbi:MAG: pseudaminic acid synthase [Hyphomicrobiales bacterium]|nr:pseudaminic acid synthase [Hyphomicrobiales bacterium]